MSFSVSTAVHPASEIRGAVENMEPAAHLGDEQLALLRQGKETAIALLDSGAIGDADAEREDIYFSASISGHAAEGSPQAGDSLVVSVAQQTAPSPSS